MHLLKKINFHLKKNYCKNNSKQKKNENFKYFDVDLKNLELSSNVIATLQDAVGSTNSGNFASYCWIVKTTPIESVDGVITLRTFFADNPRSYMTNDENFMNISIFYK